jgi:hypothetical protein
MTLTRRTILALCCLVSLSLANIAGANEAWVASREIQGDNLVAEVEFRVAGEQTLVLWGRNPLEKGESTQIATTRVRGQGRTTMRGECCYMSRRPTGGSYKICSCSSPYVTIGR